MTSSNGQTPVVPGPSIGTAPTIGVTSARTAHREGAPIAGPFGAELPSSTAAGGLAKAGAISAAFVNPYSGGDYLEQAEQLDRRILRFMEHGSADFVPYPTMWKSPQPSPFSGEG